MRLLLTFLAVFSFVNTALAQKSAITVFSQDGDRFFVILDGIRQNDAASANVKITDLDREMYVMRIIFENQNIPHLQQRVLLLDFDEKRVDVVYGISQDRRGRRNLRLSSFNESRQTPSAQNESIIKYTPVEKPTASVPATQQVNVEAPMVKTNITETKDGINADVNVMGMGVKQTITESPDSISANISITGLPTEINGVMQTSEVMATTQTTQNTERVVPAPSVEKPAPAKRCTSAMSGPDFARAKQSVEKQSFSDTRMRTANQFTRANCLSVKQIREVMDLFSFEKDKLTYAKFAYDFCVDKNNYFQLGDAFSFSSSVNELNDFIDSKQ